jgi:hypothetical protein
MNETAIPHSERRCSAKATCGEQHRQCIDFTGHSGYHRFEFEPSPAFPPVHNDARGGIIRAFDAPHIEPLPLCAETQAKIWLSLRKDGGDLLFASSVLAIEIGEVPAE